MCIAAMEVAAAATYRLNRGQQARVGNVVFVILLVCAKEEDANVVLGLV